MYGHGGHLGHVTNIMLINIHFHVPKSLHKNLVKNGLFISEKSKFLNVNDLGPRSRNDLDLEYS